MIKIYFTLDDTSQVATYLDNYRYSGSYFNTLSDISVIIGDTTFVPIVNSENVIEHWVNVSHIKDIKFRRISSDGLVMDMKERLQ